MTRKEILDSAAKCDSLALLCAIEQLMRKKLCLTEMEAKEE